MKPRLFIASSREGLPIARAVREMLADEVAVDIWDEPTTFPVGTVTLKVLEEHATKYDFAVIVMTPDDKSEHRKSIGVTPRDNLVLELGLFMGRIGAERTLIIRSDRKNMRLPTDLSGLVVAFYYEAMAKTNPKEAVSTACSQILERLKVLGVSEGRRVVQLSTAVEELAGLVNKTDNMLQHHEASQSKPARFEKVAAAEDAMVEFMVSQAEKGLGIELDWLGMTLYNVWNTLPSVLSKVASRRPRYLHLRVAMLSASWLSENRINSSWTARSANQQCAAIERFFEDLRKGDYPSWKVRIRRYSHMPAVHGGLINGRLLVSGVCRWDHGDLKAGDRPYEIFRDGDANFGSDRIDVFKGWFDACWRSAKTPSLLKWKNK